MYILTSQSVVECATAVGCTEKDWKLLTGDKPWLGVDRARVKRLLDALLYGIVDTLGIPRFDLPAEYAATVIAMGVNPTNYFAACNWVGNFSSSEDIADYHGRLEGVTGLDKVTPSRLFALILEIVSSEEADAMVSAFKHKMKLDLGYSAVMEKKPNEQTKD